MRPAKEVMAELAASGLNAEQLALVMEMAASVATEARPIVDSAAEKKRAYDREYRRNERGGSRKSRAKSYDTNDKHDPPKENIKPPVSVSDETVGEPTDQVKILFDLGTSTLTAAGQSEKQARSLVGKWRRDHGDGQVLAALTECRTRSISNPVEWIPKRLTAKPGFGEPKPLYRHLAERSRATAGGG